MQICYPCRAGIRDAGEKLQFDLYYIKHHNIFLDLLILMQTLCVILLCKGGKAGKQSPRTLPVARVIICCVIVQLLRDHA